MRKRVGDTLIEVTLAIGIFSMVAIAVVAVMNGGTTSSQTALEATLAREEIDTQAEALRFIQSAYIADKDSGETSGYNSLWGAINGLAISPTENSSAYSGFQDIISNTASCDVYNNDTFKNHAFVINPNNMGIATTNSGVFSPASTYPRLIMGNNDSDNFSNSSLSGDLSKVEGLYIFAIKDDGTTVITDADNTGTKSQSAFLDFYIRACWYGTGDEVPSTISTVVRLYNPDTTITTSKETGVWVEFNPNDSSNLTESTGSTASIFIPVGGESQLTANGFARDGYKFVGWSTNPNSTPNDVNNNKPGTYQNGELYQAPNTLSFNNKVTLYAIWQTEYFLIYNSNGGSQVTVQTECDRQKGCKTTTKTPNSRLPEGLAFKGWCTKKPSTNNGTCSGKFYKKGQQYDNVPIPVGNYKTTLYAVWTPHYTLIFYDTDEKTQLCTLDKNNDPTFNISECNKKPTNKSGHEFQGWSTNDQEPYYNKTGNNTSFTVPNSGNRTAELYPVWRVSIKFSSEGWTPHSNDGAESITCGVFNYTKPSSGSYYSVVKKGKQFGYYNGRNYSYNTAPDDGYMVYRNGKHIEVLDSGIINMQGYCATSANDYVGYTVGKDDTFELSADMNTAGMLTHPTGGYASISIGPIAAQIKDGSVTSSCQGVKGGTHNFTVDSVINLKIAKHGSDYSVSVNDKVLKSCTVATNSNVEVRYTMVHNSHGCARIFNVQLINIDMQQYKKN